MSSLLPAAGGTKSLPGGALTKTVKDFQIVEMELPAASEATIRYSAPFGFPTVRNSELRFPTLTVPPFKLGNGVEITELEFVFLYSSIGVNRLAIPEGFVIAAWNLIVAGSVTLRPVMGTCGLTVWS